MLLFYQSYTGKVISDEESTVQKNEKREKKVMKRKFVCGIAALCLALSVAGCGRSSEERQAANYYQNELGLDKEEAEELAHEIYGEDEEEPGASITEEGPEETVIEPLPELVNSEWYDRKVQILDMVFTRDEYLTEEEIRKIVEGSAYDVELTETFDENGEVCLEAIMLDGEVIVYLFKESRPDVYVRTGLFEDGDYYIFIRDENFYDKGVMEVEALDFKTRDDVLAYFAENGFVEVEEAQMIDYSYREECYYGFVGGPHYKSKGVQSITFCIVHKLNEIDQEVEFDFMNYSGCSLNVFMHVNIEFNTDGTIAQMSAWKPTSCLIMGEQID